MVDLQKSLISGMLLVSELDLEIENNSNDTLVGSFDANVPIAYDPIMISQFKEAREHINEFSFMRYTCKDDSSNIKSFEILGSSEVNKSIFSTDDKIIFEKVYNSINESGINKGRQSKYSKVEVRLSNSGSIYEVKLKLSKA